MLDLGFVQGRQDKNRIVPYGRKELVFHSSLTHQLAPFIRQTGNPLCPYVNIDVNTDIIWGENGSKTDMDYVLLQTEPSSLNGTAFMKLRREMEFISLCLHHYKDMNSIYLLYGRGLKLSLFSDIYFYLQNAKPDAAELIRCAERLSVSQYVRYCLYFTGLVFGDEITGSYDRYFPGSINEDMLRSYGLDRREIRRWTMPFFDRLLSPDFRREFEKTLSEDDRRKIALNEAVME